MLIFLELWLSPINFLMSSNSILSQELYKVLQSVTFLMHMLCLRNPLQICWKRLDWEIKPKFFLSKVGFQGVKMYIIIKLYLTDVIFPRNSKFDVDILQKLPQI